MNKIHRNKERDRKRELVSKKGKGGFKCSHCGQWIPFSKFIGTAHRNHCPLCLWSKHIDLEKPGDRKSKCKAGMKPIGLTFKREGIDKYGRQKKGEPMLIHECTQCRKISINRIASDDNSEAILKVFEESKRLNPAKVEGLKQDGIKLLREEDRKEVLRQLFGKNLEG